LRLKPATNQKLKERKNNQFITDWLEKNTTEEKINSAGGEKPRNAILLAMSR
jgi:hypothetical protein